MKHLDLFSGIGGFALAARWAGFHTVAFSEIDNYASRTLSRNFPGVRNIGDIRSHTEKIGCDILTGGFPCQPFSVAGLQKGPKDHRHLWPEMLRVIAHERPTWIVGENVTGLIGLGLDQVLFDLEAEGYATRAFIIPAVAVDAPHRRDRVWIIGHTNSNRKSNVALDAETSGMPTVGHSESVRWDAAHTAGSAKNQEPERKVGGSSCFVANSCGAGCKELNPATEPDGPRFNSWSTAKGWQPWPAEPGVGRVVDGISNRVDRIRALGNAIVPQVAYRIFQAIKMAS